MAKGFVSFKVRGGKALDKRLMRMDKRMAGKAIKQGMKKSMEPVQALAKQRAPYKSGNLRRSIRIAVYSGKNYAGAAVRTGTRKQLKIPADAKFYYPAAFEYGTRQMRARSYLRSSLFDRRKMVLERVVKDVTHALEKR